MNQSCEMSSFAAASLSTNQISSSSDGFISWAANCRGRRAPFQKLLQDLRFTASIHQEDNVSSIVNDRSRKRDPVLMLILKVYRGHPLGLLIKHIVSGNRKAVCPFSPSPSRMRSNRAVHY